MADAQNAEFKSFNLHSAGSDYVEGSALVVKSSSGAISIDGVAVGSVNALYITDPVAHDAADAGNPVKIGGYAKTAAPTAVSADGDRVNAWFSRYGALATILTDATGAIVATGQQYIEDTAITANAGQGTLVVARRDDALSALTPAQDDAVGLRVGDKGALWVQISDGSGNQITSFGGGTQYVGDAAATSTPTGTISMGLASAAAPTNVSADNDAVAAWHLRNGAQVVNLSAAGALIGGDATGGLHAQGAIAHDAVDSGNPVKIGGRTAGSGGLSPAVANGDRTDAWFDVRGALATTVTVAGSIVGAVDTASDAVASAGTSLAVAATAMVSNGSTWDRMREAPSADGQARTGLAAAAGVVFNSSTYDRMRSVQGVVAGASSDVGILAAGIGPGYSRIPAAVAASGATTATVSALGAKQAVFRITGTFTGFAATVQVSYDGTNYLTVGTNQAYIDGLGVSAFGTAITATAATGTVFVETWGAQAVRLNVTAVASGTATITPTANALASIPAASSGGGTQYVGDAAATATPTGTIAMGLASAAAPTNVSADNDAVAFWSLRNGAQVVNLSSAGALIGGDATGGLHVQGAVAHDAVDSGNPVKIGGQANSSMPSNVAAGDRVNQWFTLQGIAMVGTSGGRVNAADAVSNSALIPSIYDQTGAFNTLYNGSIPLYFNGTSWDRGRSIESLSTAPNVATGIPASGIGPGFDRKTDPAGVAATSTANAITYVVNGADIIVFQITTIGTTPGSMIFESTSDDSTWGTHGQVLKLGAETWIQGAFVPAVGDRYMLRSNGDRQVRLRVNAVYASGTVTAKITAATGTAMVKTIDVAPAPHNNGFALTSATAQYTTTQTSTTLGPTVSSTQRMVVYSVQIGAGGTTAGTYQLYFGTGAYSRGTNKAIIDHEFAPSATLKPGMVLTPAIPYMGAADEELKVTTSAAINPLTVTVWYYLVAA